MAWVKKKMKPFCDIPSKRRGQIFMIYLLTFDSEYDIYLTKKAKTGSILELKQHFITFID